MPSRSCPIPSSLLQVLGIPKNADYNTIQRAYRKKSVEAIADEAEKARIEAAHSSIMMSALTSRLQGNTSVDKNVLYADRARFFPWRPRVFFAERQVMLYAGVAQAVLLAWALLSPMTAGTQPVVWCKFKCISSFIVVYFERLNCHLLATDNSTTAYVLY